MVASWKKWMGWGASGLLAAIPWLVLWGCSSVDSGIRPSHKGPELSVTFLYEDESASEVCVAGDFNAWGTRSHCMRKGDKGWTLQVELPPGRYSYVLVVDGRQWLPDPGAMLREENGFGGESSILIVE